MYEQGGMAYLLDQKTLAETPIAINLFAKNLLRVLEGGSEVRVRLNGAKPVMVHGTGGHYRCTVSEILEERECKPHPMLPEYRSFLTNACSNGEEGNDGANRERFKGFL